MVIVFIQKNGVVSSFEYITRNDTVSNVSLKEKVQKPPRQRRREKNGVGAEERVAGDQRERPRRLSKNAPGGRLLVIPRSPVFA